MPHTPDGPEDWLSDEAVLQLHGRLHVLEHLLAQLLYQGLKHDATKLALVEACKKLEDDLQHEVLAARGQRKRVIEHARTAFRELSSALVLSLQKTPLGPLN